MIQEINKFSDILISDKKTLVICDIDNTLLYFDKDINYFYHFIKSNMVNLHIDSIMSETLRLYNLYTNTNNAKHTDSEGFNEMLNLQNVKIIFLTSRHINSTDLTKKNFNHIGLNYNNFNVHYTNYETSRVSKGDYILNNKFILDDYEDIIFIDDSDMAIDSVNMLLPHIKCYKFNIKLNY
jgi:hypothetical protein